MASRNLLVTVPGDGPNADHKTPGHALVYFGSASFGDAAGRKSLRVDGDADNFSFAYTAARGGRRGCRRAAGLRGWQSVDATLSGLFTQRRCDGHLAPAEGVKPSSGCPPAT